MPRRLSQRNHVADRVAAAVDGWHGLWVANPTFLLVRHGSECTDLQGLRERHDTAQPPEGVTDGPRRWITRYLNCRFLRLPEHFEAVAGDQHGDDPDDGHSASTSATTSSSARVPPEPYASATRWPSGGCSNDDHLARRREAAIWPPSATRPPST
ncbi:MAG TPA: hypothetical protein VEF89_05665 [Solirubrobacteraceae bacterium]|nr:hypothetical protein [Solirubrobacteraceae bacterium]